MSSLSPPHVVQTDDLIVIKAARRTRQVKLEGENGQTDVLTIYEMTGPDRNAFRADMARRFKTGADGTSTCTDFKDIEAALLTRCVHLQAQPIPLGAINKWPASVLDQVYKVCQEMNALGEEAEESVKND